VVLVCLLAVRMRWQCRWGAVSVSSGRGIGVTRTRCRCQRRRHREAVLVSTFRQCRRLRMVRPTPPTRRAPPEYPQVAPNARAGYCPLHQQRVTQCPALPFAPAASTTPLMLLRCHLMRAAGMTTAAVPMQRTSRRVAEADAANSRRRRDMIQSAKVRDSERAGNVRIAKEREGNDGSLA